ncbi:hypothetical protein CABS01_06623 [Colletotrichum abscissum]|uniref:uncharacterized protein n=1 Tax=Colletotrichum abscissum TaxID=1671311 RepID=UPI0027D5AB26|nr:uncharacterized protein CABS01_06623 [Colletotrichum abscissum]KAK1514644.1 hypothetical protein CABS01_06623 [Colletotrichum abscissum]
MAAQVSPTGDCYLETTTSILLGIVIGLTMLNFGKVLKQTSHIYSKTKSFTNLYSWMIWILLLASPTQAIIDWLFIVGHILKRSVIPGFSAADILLWVFQTQLTPQIIANRLGLIMTDKKKVRIMKCVLLVIIGIMNATVICMIFLIQATYPTLGPHIQKFYAPIDKAFGLLTDLLLNLAFIWKVHHELIANGLTKYRLLFNLNIAAIILSLSMDIALLVVVLVLPNSFIYTCIHPIVYSVKLAIELMMADLIVQVTQEQYQMPEI